MSFRMALLTMVAVSVGWNGGQVLAEESYDPLKLPEKPKVVNLTSEVEDAARSRTIPVRIYRPAETKDAPVILYSHGLGGTYDVAKYLGEHWAGRGYVGVFLQHPGSDEGVWKDVPRRERMRAMRDAASGENLRLRVGDVRAVLDRLEQWNAEQGHELAGTLDLKRVGMSGHSFGAQTTQAVSGQWFPVYQQQWTDPRIKAAVVMSPGGSRGDNDRAFGQVRLPWLLMTGTEDVAPIGGQTVESRLAVYPALPAGDKYELVLEGAKHAAFTDHDLRGQRRNPAHHKSILALSTAFWDAYLREDAAAKAWLTGPPAKAVLDAKDTWKRK